MKINEKIILKNIDHWAKEFAQWFDERYSHASFKTRMRIQKKFFIRKYKELINK